MNHWFSLTPSPIGELLLVADSDGLCGLHLHGHKLSPAIQSTWRKQPANSLLKTAAAQLREYFAGVRRVFDLPISLHGTDFQVAVWRQLQMIPHGTTTTYAEIARQLGRASAMRAVGAAVGKNPVSIIVPCHRVVGSDGSLTGFAWGLPCKRFLLDLEQPQQKLNMTTKSRKTQTGT